MNKYVPKAGVRDAVRQLLFDSQEILLAVIVLLQIFVESMGKSGGAFSAERNHAISGVTKKLLLGTNG